MRLSDITESRSATLYHLMTSEKALYVFEHDRLDARWEHDIPGVGRLRGNSFSRNPRFQFAQAYVVRLSVDQDALFRRHRLIPLDAEYVHAHTIGTRPFSDRWRNSRISGGTPYAEEFVVGPIKQLHRYLDLIEINRHGRVRPDTLNHLVGITGDYASRFSIPLHIDPRVIAEIEQWKRQWDDE